MADTQIQYSEVRFDIRGALTECYVYIDNLSNDGMLGVQGWHHKSFPFEMSILDIMQAWADGKESPLMWDMGAPR